MSEAAASHWHPLQGMLCHFVVAFPPPQGLAADTSARDAPQDHQFCAPLLVTTREHRHQQSVLNSWEVHRGMPCSCNVPSPQSSKTGHTPTDRGGQLTL